MIFTNNKLCFINKAGEIMIEPEGNVDDLYYPKHGVCLVVKGDLYGFINTNGQIVIPLQYEIAYDFSDNGLAFVMEEGELGGYINTAGHYVIPPAYEEGSFFECGLAAVKEDGSYKYINRYGETIIDAAFSEADQFASCGLAKVVTQDGETLLIDTEGKTRLVLDAGYELGLAPDNKQLTTLNYDGKEALINRQGQVLSQMFDHVIVTDFGDLHPFCLDGLWGYINSKGEIIIPNLYNKVEPFSEEGKAIVEVMDPFAVGGSSSFYIDSNGTIIDENVERKEKDYSDQFEHVYRFYRGLALAVLPVEEQETWEEEEEWDEEPYDLDQLKVQKDLHLIKIVFNDMPVKNILSLLSNISQHDFMILRLESHCLEVASAFAGKDPEGEVAYFVDKLIDGHDAVCHSYLLN